MQGWRLFVPFVSLLIAIPLVFGLAYLAWKINPFTAAMVVFVGVSALLLEGLRVLNRAVMKDSQSKTDVL